MLDCGDYFRLNDSDALEWAVGSFIEQNYCKEALASSYYDPSFKMKGVIYKRLLAYDKAVNSFREELSSQLKKRAKVLPDLSREAVIMGIIGKNLICEGISFIRSNI